MKLVGNLFSQCTMLLLHSLLNVSEVIFKVLQGAKQVRNDPHYCNIHFYTYISESHTHPLMIYFHFKY